ncbi:hypothetical protein EVAR_95194_1 [Eumeta japonica]|uniref:Uncharacterized protein n=1 Tax=Eumeta variegata TaxID=151549 RepID=A0A4C1VFZ6_EUMVA|nr:hypothetical protein EVAR_95194_1 [Eumeta japonica]
MWLLRVRHSVRRATDANEICVGGDLPEVCGRVSHAPPNGKLLRGENNNVRSRGGAEARRWRGAAAALFTRRPPAVPALISGTTPRRVYSIETACCLFCRRRGGPAPGPRARLHVTTTIQDCVGDDRSNRIRLGSSGASEPACAGSRSREYAMYRHRAVCVYRKEDREIVAQCFRALFVNQIIPNSLSDLFELRDEFLTRSRIITLARVSKINLKLPVSDFFIELMVTPDQHWVVKSDPN